MARLWSSQFLTCFYCGKRSGLKYDGVLREFLCLYCDATNYLDENGEITDPPVATEREAPPTSYAVPKASNSTADSVFCPKCLQNQHLFTKSLAQYFPDDTSDPDYDELDRNYYQFRKRLEERYPQVCDDCAVRVDSRLQQAAYTARTDYLRRAMEMTRRRRAAPKTTTLDWIHGFGKWTWWCGFILQMLWHAVLAVETLEPDQSGMYDPDDRSSLTKFAHAFVLLARLVPNPDTIIRWSITAAVVSAWWNPHFVQVNRGFTRHLLGFTQWYAFQGLIIFFRVAFKTVLNMQVEQTQSRDALLSAHVVMAAMMSLIYVLAKRSIKVDTRPLFGASGAGLSPSQSPKQTRNQSASPRHHSDHSSKTLSQLLDEALDTPGQIADVTSPTPPEQLPMKQLRSHDSPQIPLGGLGLTGGTPQRVQEVQYDEDMDWSPVNPLPRALSGDSQPRAFGQAPVREQNDPFWYKVPAAPTTPAERLRNPKPLPTMLRKPSEEKRAPMFTSTVIENGKKGAARRVSGDVEFKPQRFHGSKVDADTSSLADMLGRSIKLNQESDQNNEEITKRVSESPVFGQRKKASVNLIQQQRQPSIVPLVFLAMALGIWLLVTLVDVPYQSIMKTAALAAGGVLALIRTGDPNRSEPGQPSSFLSQLLSVFGAVELAAFCWIGWEVTSGRTDVDIYATGVLTALLAHQALVTFRRGE